MIHIIFLLPAIYFLVGLLMRIYPPKKINYFVGYRTSRSMKNKKNWDIANKYCAEILIKLGIFLFLVSLLIFILSILEMFVFTENMLLGVTLIETIAVFIPIFIVERKLFENGKK